MASGPTFNNSLATAVTSALATYNVGVTGCNPLDTILFFIINSTNANPTILPTSVVDSVQGPLSLAASVQNSFNHSIGIYALVNANPGSHTITPTFASAVASTNVWMNFSNPTGSFVDQAGGNYNSASATYAQALTNVQSNDTVVSFVDGGAVAWASQSGTNVPVAGLGSGTLFQWQTQAGSGLITPNFVASLSTYGSIAAVSLQNNPALASGGNFFLMQQFRR